MIPGAPGPGTSTPRLVPGIDALEPDDGPAFVVVGVFDGLHLGHAYLLGHLVREAAARRAVPTVVTFDAHPDAILRGHAPPLLLDPAERTERLGLAGVETIVVQHFDDALRRTEYDVFVDRIRARVALAGILMTPDAAFGHERRGTAEALADLGRARGFDVVVVPPFSLDGSSVRSTDVRVAIETGDLARAARLLGRPYAIVGRSRPGGELVVDLPVARPPDGAYPAAIEGRPVILEVTDGRLVIGDGRAAGEPGRRLRVDLGAPIRPGADEPG